MLKGHRRAMRRLELVCWCAAALAIGIYAYVYLDRTVYQAYQEWSFEQALGHEHKPASIEWGRNSAEPTDAYRQLRREVAAKSPVLKPGAPIGRMEIPRIGLEAMVVESTTSEALRRAVGHVEGTALPGYSGNVGLAGHRDTFFRGLQEVRKGDVIRVDTLNGSWEYQVESITVVDPEDIEVLKASAHPTLTLVTCYPFNYVGSAPRRFIVRARERLAKLKPSPGF
jgi:sortase A